MLCTYIIAYGVHFAIYIHVANIPHIQFITHGIASARTIALLCFVTDVRYNIEYELFEFCGYRIA